MPEPSPPPEPLPKRVKKAKDEGPKGIKGALLKVLAVILDALFG
jgi:hypothetical protein